MFSAYQCVFFVVTTFFICLYLCRFTLQYYKWPRYQALAKPVMFIGPQYALHLFSTLCRL